MSNNENLSRQFDVHYGFDQGVYAVASAGLGLVFSHVHQLGGTVTEVLTVYWPVLLAVFISTITFSTLFERFVFNGERKPVDRYLWIAPIAAAGFGFLALRPYAATSQASGFLFIGMALYAAVFSGANILLFHREKLCPQGVCISATSMRYVLVAPLLFVVIANIAFGGFVPLLLEGNWIPDALLFLLLSYLALYFYTRDCERNRFASIHVTILGIVSVTGAIFYVLNYVISPDALECSKLLTGFFTQPMKVSYLAVYIGLYLSIPEGFGYAWKEKSPCTKDVTSSRMQMLNLLLSIYNPFVYLTFIEMEMSAAYIILYAIGSVGVVIYTSKARKPAYRTLWRLIFLLITVGFLTLEFSGGVAPIFYKIPKPDIAFLAVIIFIIEITFTLIELCSTKAKTQAVKASEENNVTASKRTFWEILLHQPQEERRCLRRTVLLFMQIFIMALAGITGYTDRIQLALTASCISFLVEAFYIYFKTAFPE